MQQLLGVPGGDYLVLGASNVYGFVASHPINQWTTD